MKIFVSGARRPRPLALRAPGPHPARRGFTPPRLSAGPLPAILAALLLLAVAPVAHADDALAPADGLPRLKPGDVPIRSVMVYPDGAIVTRKAHVSLPIGRSVVVFEGLTPTLDEASLVAKLAGSGARVAGVSADWQGSLEPARDSEAKLTADIESLATQIQAQNDALSALAQRRAVLDQYRNLLKDAVAQDASDKSQVGESSKWRDAVAFLSKEQDAIDAGQRAAQQKIQDLSEQESAKQQELAKIQAGAQRKTRRVEVEVESDHGGDADVSLDYQVPGASWAPAYDVRASDDAGAKVAFVYYGTVAQQTGEDWNDVALTLSTARPNAGAQVPTLTALLLEGHKKSHEPVQIVSYGKEKAKDEGKKQDMANGTTPTSGRTRVDDHGIAVTFSVQGRESVPADHRPHKVEVASFDFAASTAYEAVPKLEPFVYLKATAKNGSDYPILAGDVDVFRSSGYVGSGHLEYVAPGEEFSVSLGVDDDLKVRRVIDERVDRKPKLLGSTRTLAYGYRIEVMNYRADKQTVTIVENIPVSQRKEVKVDLRDGTTKPDEQDDQGFLKWKVSLDPSSTKTIDFGYTVEYPQSFQIDGL